VPPASCILSQGKLGETRGRKLGRKLGTTGTDRTFSTCSLPRGSDPSTSLRVNEWREKTSAKGGARKKQIAEEVASGEWRAKMSPRGGARKKQTPRPHLQKRPQLGSGCEGYGATGAMAENAISTGRINGPIPKSFRLKGGLESHPLRHTL
jgi:hypothetical protein